MDELHVLDLLDEQICHIENSIFEGPFRAERIKEMSELLELQIRLGDEDRISEKKDYYSDTFNEFSGDITFGKEQLEKLKEKSPKNQCVLQLLEKFEKCEKEIENLRGILDDYF